jgi:hypothetical protein
MRFVLTALVALTLVSAPIVGASIAKADAREGTLGR